MATIELEATVIQSIRVKAKALDLVVAERHRQEQLKAAGRFKFTPADAAMPDGDRLATIVEEVGEVARAMQESHGSVSDIHHADLKKELVQVAALSVAWLEHLLRSEEL